MKNDVYILCFHIQFCFDGVRWYGATCYAWLVSWIGPAIPKLLCSHFFRNTLLQNSFIAYFSTKSLILVWWDGIENPFITYVSAKRLNSMYGIENPFITYVPTKRLNTMDGIERTFYYSCSHFDGVRWYREPFNYLCSHETSQFDGWYRENLLLLMSPQKVLLPWSKMV